MPELSWSLCSGKDCMRLAGLGSATGVEVRPRTAGQIGGTPPMAGQIVHHGKDLCFVPRFSFVEGTTYAVSVRDLALGTILRPRPSRPVTTEVIGIYPTATEVPRNLLRLYVRFSAPMSEGYAAEHIRLLDEAGSEMAGALLATENELWDENRERLTVLLDPARIKRGLVPHRQAGYPLRIGMSFRLTVGEAIRDAEGSPLRTSAARRYRVGDDERRRVLPEHWALEVPPSRTTTPLDVRFDRPLDHFLLARCLHVLGPDGALVEGRTEVGMEGRSWRLTPRSPWTPEPHRLVIDAVLEDLAGNSVGRVFDRDLTRPEDAPREGRQVTLAFDPA